MRLERSNFQMRKSPEYNVYDCIDCQAVGLEHKVQHVPYGHTSHTSFWGEGHLTTILQCSGVSAQPDRGWRRCRRRYVLSKIIKTPSTTGYDGRCGTGL